MMSKIEIRKICVQVFNEEISLDMTIRDIPSEGHNVMFNGQQAHLVGATRDCWRGCINLFFRHSDFPLVKEGVHIPIYALEEAKKQFPFLFTEEFKLGGRYIDF